MRYLSCIAFLFLKTILAPPSGVGGVILLIQQMHQMMLTPHHIILTLLYGFHYLREDLFHRLGIIYDQGLFEADG